MADYYVSNGVISSNLILDDGWMPITSGGTASKTTVTNKGIVHVSDNKSRTTPTTSEPKFVT